MNRRIYFPAAVIGLAAVVVAGCSEAPTDTSGPSADDLRGHAVTALDFPRSVFGEWEVTDPEIRPADMIPAIAQAVGTTDEWEVDSADCAPGVGSALHSGPHLAEPVPGRDRWEKLRMPVSLSSRPWQRRIPPGSMPCPTLLSSVRTTPSPRGPQRRCHHQARQQ